MCGIKELLVGNRPLIIIDSVVPLSSIEIFNIFQLIVLIYIVCSFTVLVHSPKCHLQMKLQVVFRALKAHCIQPV